MEIKKDFQFDEGYAWHKECYDKFAEKMNRLNHRTRKIRY